MTDPAATDEAQRQQVADPEQPRQGAEEEQADLVSAYDDGQLSVPDVIYHG